MKYDAHTSTSCFWLHEPGVCIWTASLSEAKLSIQNPYLGRMHIDFRGYFFPEKGCVKKVRTSCLSPAARCFCCWGEFQHLWAWISTGEYQHLGELMVSLTLTFSRLFPSFLHISLGDKQTNKIKQTTKAKNLGQTPQGWVSDHLNHLNLFLQYLLKCKTYASPACPSISELLAQEYGVLSNIF